MRVVVLGSGMVGQAIATRLLELGHDVPVGEATRNAAPCL
jgi:predicted dinucleotide-binding enzyme